MWKKKHIFLELKILKGWRPIIHLISRYSIIHSLWYAQSVLFFSYMLIKTRLWNKTMTEALTATMGVKNHIIKTTIGHKLFYCSILSEQLCCIKTTEFYFFIYIKCVDFRLVMSPFTHYKTNMQYWPLVSISGVCKTFSSTYRGSNMGGGTVM